MTTCIYDPEPIHNDYLSRMYFDPMRLFAERTLRRPMSVIGNISNVRDSVVLCHSDHLTPSVVSVLKNNNCKIAGFSINDSCWITDSCRAGACMNNVDLIFLVAGIQKTNVGHEMVVDTDFNIALEKRQFLPEDDWKVFHEMHQAGRLQSLPYVHWEKQADVPAQPYSARSQKALIRGGHHMRRFILALKLMEIDRLDINSGFVTEPYFQDGMNPQFRYCDECREIWKRNKKYPVSSGNGGAKCCNPEWGQDGWQLSNLGAWNNRCPESFYRVSDKFSGDRGKVENLMNARWLPQRDHLEMLARITFTSDLKWLFSIYAAQRFWDAAMVGCVNLLPRRTIDQEYFPHMEEDVHYRTFVEDFHNLDEQSALSETWYSDISKAAKALYDDYLRPTDYAIGTPILRHIFDHIERLQ